MTHFGQTYFGHDLLATTLFGHGQADFGQAFPFLVRRNQFGPTLATLVALASKIVFSVQMFFFLAKKDCQSVSRNSYRKYRPSLSTSCMEGMSPSTPGAVVSSRDKAKLRAAVHARRHRHR